MTPERWQQIKRLCELALDREPDERAAFLSEACAADPELRQQVEDLLQHATVGIDSHGRSLYDEEQAVAQERMPAILERLDLLRGR